MENDEAGKYVCPFMSKPVKESGPELEDNFHRLLKIYCVGVECMAWNPTRKNEGFCNLAFPEEEEK